MSDYFTARDCVSNPEECVTFHAASTAGQGETINQTPPDIVIDLFVGGIDITDFLIINFLDLAMFQVSSMADLMSTI